MPPRPRPRPRPRPIAVASASGEQEPSDGERQNEDRSLSPSPVRRRLDHPSPTISFVDAQIASSLLHEVYETFHPTVNAAYRGDTVSVGAETTAFKALFQAAVQSMEAASRQTSASAQRAVAAAEAAAEERVAAAAGKLAIAEARMVAAEARQSAAAARAKDTHTLASKDLLQSNVSDRGHFQARREQVGPSPAAVAVDNARSPPLSSPTSETLLKSSTLTPPPAPQQQSLILSSSPIPRHPAGLALSSLQQRVSSSARSPPRKMRHSAYPTSPLKTPVQAALARLTPRKVRSPRSPKNVRSPPPSSPSPLRTHFQLESSSFGVDTIGPGKSSSPEQEKGMPETDALAPGSAALQLRLPFDGLNGISVYQRDLDTLQEGAWVNDTIIDACLFVRRQQIQANDEKLAFSIEIFPCHFWAVLTTDAFKENAGKYGQDGDIFDKDYLVFPVNLNRSHWILAILVNPGRAIDGSIHRVLASKQSEQSVDSGNQKLVEEDSQTPSVISDDDCPPGPQSYTRFDLSAMAALVIFDSLTCGSGGAGDSPESHRNVFSTLRKYIFDTAQRQHPDTITSLAQIRIDCVSAAVPQQDNGNGNDCGMHLTHFFTVFFDKPFQFKVAVIPSRNASDSRWRAGEVGGLRQRWRTELAEMGNEWKELQKTQSGEGKLAGGKGTSSRPKRKSLKAGRISSGSTKVVRKPS